MTWNKPKCVVLVKGKPEEQVLAGCKTTGVWDADPDWSNNGCDDVAGTCLKCDTFSAS